MNRREAIKRCVAVGGAAAFPGVALTAAAPVAMPNLRFALTANTAKFSAGLARAGASSGCHSAQHAYARGH